MSTDEVDEVLTQSTVNGHPLGIFQKATVRTLFLKARQLAAPPSTPAPSSGNAALAPPPNPPAVSARRQVRHSLIIAQTDESTSELISDQQHVTYLRRYELHFGAGDRPPPAEEPNAEQLTALKCILDDGSVPYVDFAIFGPHASRLARKMRLQGTKFRSDGSLGPIEIHGPCDGRFSRRLCLC